MGYKNYQSRTLYPPKATLVAKYEEDVLVGIVANVGWKDNQCRCEGQKCRAIDWLFLVNGELVHTTGFELIKDLFEISNASTYDNLSFPNGQTDIENYLGANGIALEDGDEVCVQINARNCNDLVSKKPSNKVCFVSGEVVAIACTKGWQTVGNRCWATMAGEVWGVLG